MYEYRCDLRSHGTHQLELKTWYPVYRTGRERYDLDLFVFTPAQLQLDEQHYGQEGFLADLRTYTRYSTPSMSLREFSDPENGQSPINRIVRRADRSAGGSHQGIVFELRTACNVFRVAARERRHVLRERINAGAAPADVRHDLESLLDDIEEAVEHFRTLHGPLRDHDAPQRVTTAFRWADEAISIKTEVEMYKLHNMVQTTEGLGECIARTKRRMIAETEYREERGYDSIVRPGDDRTNEHLLYRESILKKWSQSVMYLSSEESEVPNQAGHVAAGIAAAAAMSFAVVATLLAQQLFAAYSVPWALLIVVSYIFKDRIKEILRNVMAAVVPRVVADAATKLIDPSAGGRVGISKDLVQMSKAANTPAHVRAVRSRRTGLFTDMLPDENVIHLHKRTRLNGKKLLENNDRIESITEILRIKLDEWLEEMDDPENRLYYVDDAGNMQSVGADRVYHAHVVVVLSQVGSETAGGRFHYRVVASRRGLVRIEEVDTTDTGDQR